MLSDWLSRLMRPAAKCSPSGEIMVECLNRKVMLVACEDGSINLHGQKRQVDTMLPFIEKHLRDIRTKLFQFQCAVTPPQLSALH